MLRARGLTVRIAREGVPNVHALFLIEDAIQVIGAIKLVRHLDAVPATLSRTGLAGMGG